MSNMENKSTKFLVEDTIDGVVQLEITNSKPRSTTAISWEFDNDIVTKYISHLGLRSHTLRPQNPKFNDNLRLLQRNFSLLNPKWLLEFLENDLGGDNPNTNKVTTWVEALTAYNSSYANKFTTELDYLNKLLSYASHLFVDEITKKDTIAQRKNIKLLNELAKGGKGVELTTSIKMDSTLIGTVSEGLGTVYNAHIMLASKLKEDKQNLFYIHAGVYSWLKALPSSIGLYTIDSVKTFGKNSLELILSEKKSASINTTLLSPPYLLDLMRKGIIMFEDLDARQKVKVTPLDINLLSAISLLDLIRCGVIKFEDLDARQKAEVNPLMGKEAFVRRRETFYESLLRKLKEIAVACKYEQKWEEETIVLEIQGKGSEISEIVESNTSIEQPNLVRQSSNYKTFKKTNFGKDEKTWREKLDNLAQEVIRAIRKPITISEKSKGKKVKIDKYTSAVADAMKECFMFEKDFTSTKKDEEMEKEKGNTTPLDERQRVLVLDILAGLSIIAVWPTSSGKTFASMVALESLFRNNKESTLIYVAPNFYQSLQAYCSLVRSFPGKVFGLVTGLANITPPDCKYWVGTPEAVWLFAKSSEMTFNIGIIDEIHVVSSPENASLEEKNRALALSRIISLITNQFIGLSATVRPGDKKRLRKFVKQILAKAKVNIKIKKDLEEKIKRFIKLESTIFTGDDIVSLVKIKLLKDKPSTTLTSSSSSHEFPVVSATPTPFEINLPRYIVPPIKNIPVTSENTFNMLKLLENKKMTPALIFDLEEKDSYTLFGNLIKYIHDRYNSEYVIWRSVAGTFNGTIDSFNKEVRGYLADKAFLEETEYQGRDNDNEENQSKKKKDDKVKKNSNVSAVKVKAQYNTLKDDKERLISRIIEFISVNIRSNLGIKEDIKTIPLPPKNIEEGEKKVEEPKKKSTRPRRRLALLSSQAKTVEELLPTKSEEKVSQVVGDMVDVSSTLREIAPSLTKGKAFILPNKISYEIKDLYDQLIVLKAELSSSLKEISQVCTGVGSYFRFGLPSKTNVFRSFINPTAADKMKEEERANYNFIVSLSDAEGVKPNDVRQIFKLMDLALSFGIGILIPTMPFSVQYQILQMLKAKDITIVFASESMSMGVNFPAKTCVIRTISNKPPNIGKVLQMQGRAGRRGVSDDLFGYSVSWNIPNISMVHPSNTPYLVLDANKIIFGTISTTSLVPTVVNGKVVEPKMDMAGILIKSHLNFAIKIDQIMISADNLGVLKMAAEQLEQVTAKIVKKKTERDGGEEESKAKQHTGGAFLDKKTRALDDEKSEIADTRYIDGKYIEVKGDTVNLSNQSGNTEPFLADKSIIDSIISCIRLLCEELGMKPDIQQNLLTRVANICRDVRDGIMFEDPYYWVEKINIVKQALQEVHTVLHRRAYIALLDYMSTIYNLIHRISMIYAGLVYQKASTRSIE